MSFGIVEVITLLLGLSGFGLQTNPKAPTPDQSLQYAMPDADVVAQFDAASVIPGNYKVLQQLADQPQIKASPEVAKIVRKAIGEVEGARGAAKMATGIDVTTDITDATAFFQIVPKHDPRFVVVVHGNFSTATIDKVATLTHKTPVKVGGGAWVESDDGSAVGVTKDGTLIAGTNTLVKDRLADAWKAPAHAAGSNLGYAADVIAGHPVFAVVLTLSQNARAAALANAPGQNFITDAVKRQKVSSFALYHDGIGWSWIDSSRTGLEAMAEVSDGAIDLLRAAQVAPRGFAKIALGALESYKGTDKRIDDLIRHKSDLMKLVDAYVGDGTFKAQVDKDPKTLRLTVRLSGKSLSDVLPLGSLVPLGALGFLTRAEAAPLSSSPQLVLPPPPPPPALKKRP